MRAPPDLAVRTRTRRRPTLLRCGFAALGYKRLENLSLLWPVGHLLRVPLHGEQERVILGGFDGFNQTVFGVRPHSQPSAQPLDCLVAQAAHPAIPLKLRSWDT